MRRQLIDEQLDHMCRLLARHIRSLDVGANLYGRNCERRTWWNRGIIPGWMMQRWIDRTYQEIYSAIELQEMASLKELFLP
jgi:hypothetical protein